MHIPCLQLGMCSVVPYCLACAITGMSRCRWHSICADTSSIQLHPVFQHMTTWGQVKGYWALDGIFLPVQLSAFHCLYFCCLDSCRCANSMPPLSKQQRRHLLYALKHPGLILLQTVDLYPCACLEEVGVRTWRWQCIPACLARWSI